MNVKKELEHFQQRLEVIELLTAAYAAVFTILQIVKKMMYDLALFYVTCYRCCQKLHQQDLDFYLPTSWTRGHNRSPV